MNSAVLAFIIKYKWIIIAIIVLAIIIYIAYKKGKSYRPAPVPIPPDIQTGDPNTFDPTNYTDAIFNDIDCYFCLHDATPYENANTLSNSQLTIIWNDWNRRYFQKYNMDLVSALCQEFTAWNYSFDYAACALIRRFKELKLATNACEC